MTQSEPIRGADSPADDTPDATVTPQADTEAVAAAADDKQAPRPWASLAGVLVASVGVIRLFLWLTASPPHEPVSYSVTESQMKLLMREGEHPPRTDEALDRISERVDKLREPVYLVQAVYKRPSADLLERAGVLADKLREKLDGVERDLNDLVITPLEANQIGRRQLMLLEVERYRKLLNVAPAVMSDE